MQDDDALIDKLSDLCRRIQGCWQSPTGQPPPRRAKSFTPEWKDAGTLLDAMIFIERNRISASRLSADHTGVLVEALPLLSAAEESLSKCVDQLFAAGARDTGMLASQASACVGNLKQELERCLSFRGEQSPDASGGGE